MTFNKKIAKTLVFALGFGMLLPIGTQSIKAADEFNEETGIITQANAKFWAVVKKVKKEKGSDLTITAGAKKEFYKLAGDIDTYSEAGVYVGALGANKNIYVAIGNNEKIDTTWKVYSVTNSEDDKTFKVGYVTKAKDKFNKVEQVDGISVGSAKTGFIVFTAGKKPKGVAKTDVLVKKEGGNWDTVANVLGNDDVILSRLIQTGANLVFKKKGTNGTAGTWGSKDVKFKLLGSAKAPAVKADIVKNEFSTRKGMEYKILWKDNAAATGTNWTNVPEKKKLTFAEIINDGANLGARDKKWIVGFRTAATVKKMASKEMKITFNPQAAPTAPDNFVNTFNDTSSKAGVVIKGASDAPLVTIKPVYYYDMAKKGVVIENADTTNNYEFYIDWNKDAATAEKDIKWIKLNKAKDATKPTTVKIKASENAKVNTFKVGQAAKIHIRLVGEKQTKENIVKLPGAEKALEFTLSDIVQEVKLNAKAPGAVELEIDEFSKEQTFTLPLLVEKLQDKNAKLTLKTDAKPKGITFTLPKKFEGANKADIVLEIDDKIFTKAEDFVNGKFSLTVSTEGVKEQKFDITFKKKGT